MHGVRALGDDKLPRHDLHGILQLHGSAVEPAVENLPAAVQRQQHFFEKTLAVHVPAGLGKARGGALLRAEKKVVHMKHGAAILLGKYLAERCFAACAPALNGETHRHVPGEPPVELCEERLKNIGLVWIHISPPGQVVRRPPPVFCRPQPQRGSETR